MSPILLSSYASVGEAAGTLLCCIRGWYSQLLFMHWNHKHAWEPLTEVWREWQLVLLVFSWNHSTKALESVSIVLPLYPEIGDGNFKSTLWTFKQWLALKMWLRYGLSIVLLLTFSHKAFWDMSRLKGKLLEFGIQLKNKVASNRNSTHNWPLLVYKSDAYPTVLSRHVLNRRFLNWILFHAPL